MSIKRLNRIKNLNDNHDNVTIMTMSVRHSVLHYGSVACRIK